jgi:membrane associated rhomboid family serine protease
MLPVKDNVPTERFPLLTLVAIAIGVVAYALSTSHAGLGPFLLDVLFLGLLGPSVEDALGRGGFCGLCLLGCLLGLAVRALTGAESPAPVIFGATGVTTAVLGGYAVEHPRARVLTLVPAPLFTTIVEVPAVLLIGLWLVLQVCFGVAGLG